MKKLKKYLFIMCIIISLFFSIRFTINKYIIILYNNNIYNKELIKYLYFLNFNQPYIVYYNNGNIEFKLKNYDSSISDYEKALSFNVPKSKVCDIRINLSLSEINNITSDNEEVISKLEKSRKNLYYDDCAHENDNLGRSKIAKKLEEEIIELEKNINKDENDNSYQQNNKENNQSTKDESKLEEKIKQNEVSSNKKRQSDLSTFKNMNDYEYYSGKSW